MKIWTYHNYIVEEKEFDYDLHMFEIIQGEKILATIIPSCIEDMNEIIDALNNGEDVNGWEDGMGNTISIS